MCFQMFGPKLNFVISCALQCLRSGLSISRPLRRHSNAQEMTKFNLGPNILKAHVIELFSSRQELWLRKAANVKEENLMAFHGR